MPESRFLSLTQADATAIAQQYPSPTYIIDELGLLQRYEEFSSLAKQIYPKTMIALSYKTNPLQAILHKLHQRGAFAEVVSGEEYKMARQLGVSGKHIIFNGPMKTDKELIQAINEQAIIHCDHLEEVRRMALLARQMQRRVELGLRVSLSSIGKKWNRFGFEDLGPAINIIKQTPELCIAGLHCHIGTNIRCNIEFERMATALADIISSLYNHHRITLKWLDLGGGLAGISPTKEEKTTKPHKLPNLKDYLLAVTRPLLKLLHKHNMKLYFEPGRTLFEPFGALLTRVVSQRMHQRDHALICDAGFNALATAHVYNHPVHALNKNTPQRLTHIFGPSCNQTDQLHQPIMLPQMDPGDFVLFYGVGAYCMSFAYSFIRYRPGVIGWQPNNRFCRLRLADSLEHANQLERDSKEFQS